MMRPPAGRKSGRWLLVALAAVLTGMGLAADPPMDMGLQAVPAPPQPGAVSLPSAARENHEIWHTSSGRLAVRNVNQSTLTPFRPRGKPAPAAMIIAPGGGFLGLEMDKEGWDVARWLARHGVTAFVLKYRTLPTPVDQKVFVEELHKLVHGQPSKLALPEGTPAEALADGLAALRYVREHAGDYGVDPNRVGFMGFSAGGFLTVSLVEKGGDARPDFAAPIYPNMAGIAVPNDAPPLFVAIAADDFLLGRVKGLPLIDSYRAAGKSVELHLFSAGGHGFGAGPRGSPEEDWLDLLLRWMRTQGMLGASTRG